jgi:hypothetical protein
VFVNKFILRLIIANSNDTKNKSMSSLKNGPL